MKTSMLTALAVFLPSLASAAVCNADNCLRAIRATNRPGLEDCNSYLQTTVTPAASTVTATETQTETVTPTVYISVTESRLVLVTATVTDLLTQTTLTTITQTINGVAKRQATAIPSVIPAYASPCSGAVRFSSACSCLGAAAATVTAVAPTVTVTATDTVTVSPVTVSIQTTVATEDVTTTASTATLTSTVIVVATQTASVVLPIPPQCVELSARNMLYTFAAPARNVGPKAGFTATYPAFTDEYRSRCCAWCYSTADCTVFFFSNLGNNSGARCTLYENQTPVERNQSPTCPRGITTGQSTSQAGPSGFGLGPCFRD